MTLTRILQLTDLHVFAEPQTCLKGIPTRECLQEVIEYIRGQNIQFDHVVVTGDHTHDELQASYAAVSDLLHDWVPVLWQVPGNHDDRRVLHQVFSDRMADQPTEKIQFAFTTAEWLCLGIDTHVPGEVFGQLDVSQIDWIRSCLKQHPQMSVVLFMHHPPVVLNSIWMDQIGLRGMELLHELIAGEPRIRLICCGHVHHESAHLIEQCQVVTTPATGIQFSPLGSTPNFVAEAPGFRIIELTADGFTSRVHRLPVVRYTPTV